MRCLVLVRHGETAFNRDGRLQGSSDPPLTSVGTAQARAAGRTIGELVRAPDWAWSSDLARARETANIALDGLPCRTDPRLREIDFGAWEGRPWREAWDRDDGPFRAWLRDPETVRPPGGEALAELRARLADWLADLPERGTGVVVTHGGPLRVLLARMLALPPSWRYERGLRIVPGGVAKGVL